MHDPSSTDIMPTNMTDDVFLYLLTFNCTRTPVEISRFADHLFDALPLTDTSSSQSPPDLIALCLQEVAPIAYAFLGGSFLTPYLSRFNQVVDQAVARRWKDAHYTNVVTENVGMTALMVFARSDVAEHISNSAYAHVGLGLQQMGNKGAVGARLTYKSVSPAAASMDLTLVAAHLAPMEDAVQQRNGDWRAIVERLVFSRPSAATSSAHENSGETGDESERTALLRDSSTLTPDDDARSILIPTSYLFLAGDLNYRTSDTSPSKEDRARFPQAHADQSSTFHYSHLLKEDQLIREMKQSRTFHGLSEAPITFPPTYKYASAARQAARNTTIDDGEPEWLWTNTRWPSWCDRVLFLESPPGLDETARVKPLKYKALPLFPTSDHRAVALSALVPRRLPSGGDDATPAVAPFPIDPEWQRKRDAARTKELVVGGLAYLGWTWEGNGVLVASIVGILGTWLVLRSLFEG
ncbi:DNase I-like protein [Aspergillus ambiguus]|uniref:putative inositol 5-phosphatase n=1 Tax=Aspergillus ambiguus TaxID=176160 RepID=UPI003CCE14B6